MTGKVFGPAWRLGVFTLVCLLAGFAIVAVFDRMRFEDSHRYRAEFVSVTGLKKGDFVRIAGVEVGKVETIRISETATAIVEFTAYDDVVLTEGDRAVVRFQNLVGDRFLALVEGPGSTRILHPGDTIGIDHTAPALDLDALIGGFKPLFHALDPQQVNSLTGELVAAFQGQGPTVGSFLQHTADLTNALGDRDQVISEVIANLDAVLGSLNGQAREFDTAVTSLSQLIHGLADNKAQISDSLASSNAAAGTIADLLVQARPPASKVITETDRAAAIVVADHEYFNDLLATLPEAYRMMGRQGLYGDFFNFYTCEMLLKVNGKGGQPVYIRISSQATGRCTPK